MKVNGQSNNSEILQQQAQADLSKNKKQIDASGQASSQELRLQASPSAGDSSSLSLPTSSEGTTIPELQQKLLDLQSELAANPSNAAAIQNQQLEILNQEQQIINQGQAGTSGQTPTPPPAPPPPPAQPTDGGSTTPSTDSQHSTSTDSTPTPTIQGHGVPDGGSTSSSLSPNAPSVISQHKDVIEQAAKASGVPADLIGAVIYQESGGNSGVNATSNPISGLADSGLMQVDSATAAELESKYSGQLSGLSGDAKNVMLGALYLKDMNAGQGGDWSRTLRAYNSGPNDPSLTTGGSIGAGDPNYIIKVDAWWKAISTGQALPANYDPNQIK